MSIEPKEYTAFGVNEDGTTSTQEYRGVYFKHLTVEPSPIQQTEESYDKFVEEHTKHALVFSDSADWNMPRSIRIVEIDPTTLFEVLNDD